MAKQSINIGSAANDGTGDPLRTAFDKINDNFTEVYDNLGGSSLSSITFTGSTITNTVTNGDITIDPNGTGTVFINGPLEVRGSATEINTTQLQIEDNLLELNRNSSGGDVDAGIFVNRGAALNSAFFYWNEGEDKWKAVLSTSDDSVTSAVTDTSTATIVANFEGTTATITTVNTNILNSADSTAIQVTDSLNVSGTLSVDTIDTNTISSSDSTAIQIDDAVNISGTLSVDTIDTNTISSSDSTAIQVTDSLNVSGTLSVDTIDTNTISSNDSTAVTINEPLNVTGNVEIDGQIDATGKVAGTFFDNSSETVTGAGGANAVSVTVGLTRLDTSSGTATLSIADGTNGQVKYIVMVASGNNAVLDNTNGNWTTQILFDAVGEGVTLIFDNVTNKWNIVGSHGATIT